MMEGLKVNLGFFVSRFSPDFEFSKLEDSKRWECLLKIGDKEFRPTAIKYLKEKDRWYSFYPYVNRWSNEYLIIFSPPQDLGTGPVVFSVANVLAKTVMTW